MIPEQDSAEFSSLAALSSVEMETIGVLEVSDIEEFSGVSRFLKHITERNQNLEYATTIPDDISSAMAYRGSRHQMYLLLRYEKEYHWMLFDIARKQWQHVKEDELLDLIQCTMETPIANVMADEIERYAQECRKLWCAQNGIRNPDEVERICALYLKPRAEDDSFAGVFSK